MADPYLGEIRMFGGNYAPRDWALCNGQILPISQNTALFSLLGTMYGGNGISTFALPDLQGAAPLHRGQGPGLTDRQIGESGGTTSVTLDTATMPAHAHQFQGEQTLAESTSPRANDVAANRTVFPYTSPGAPGIRLQPMSPQAVSLTGTGGPHNNLQPYLAVTFIICLKGIFPPRD